MSTPKQQSALSDPQKYYKLGKRLTKAVKRNDVDGVQAALEAGASSFFVSDFLNPTTPLHTATKNGNKEIVELLLKHKPENVELDKIQSSMKNPIEIAAEEKNIEVIQLLIDYGFSETKVRQDSSSGVTPALPSHSSLLNGFREGALILMRHWNIHTLASDKTEGKQLWSDFHVLVAEGDAEKIIAHLEAKLPSERKEEVNKAGPFEVLPIHIAASFAPLDAFKYMTEHGGDLYSLDKVHKTAVHYACASGRLDNLKYLLEEKNAELVVDDNDTYATPLEIAVKYNRHEVVQYLLFESKRSNLLRRTELYLASYRGATESARILAKAMNIFHPSSSPATLPSEPTPAAIPIIIEPPSEDNKSTGQSETSENPRVEVLPDEDTQKPSETTAAEPVAVQLSVSDTPKVEENQLSADDPPIVVPSADDPPIIVPSVVETVAVPQSSSVQVVASAAPSETRPSLIRCLHIGTDHPSIVRYLIEELGVDPNGVEDQDEDPMPIILRAVKSAPLESIQLLADHGANVTAKKENLNAFSMSVLLDREDVSKYLLSKGAEPGDTDLIYAIQNMNDDLIKLLVQHGMDVNRQEASSGQTPLMIAILNNDLETVKLLLEHKADIKATDKKNGTPLHYAVLNDFVEAVKILVENGADISLRNKETRTLPLHDAILRKNDAIVEYFIEKGADINAEITNGLLAIHLAGEMLSPSIAKLLLSKGADPNRLAEHNLTPLHQLLQSVKREYKKKAIPESVISQVVETMQVLLDAGANVNAQDSTGTSLLQVAVTIPDDSVQIVKHLVNAKADLNVQQTQSKLSVLTIACMSKNKEVAKYLVEEKNLSVNPDCNLSPLGASCLNGDEELVKYLIDKKADVNFICPPSGDMGAQGYSPIHLACVSNPTKKLLEMLVTAGADPNQQTLADQCTPMHLLAAKGPTKDVLEAQEYLFLKGATASLTVRNDEGKFPVNMMNEEMKKLSSIYRRSIDLLQQQRQAPGEERGEKMEQQVPPMFTYGVIGVGVMIALSVVHAALFLRR